MQHSIIARLFIVFNAEDIFKCITISFIILDKSSCEGTKYVRRSFHISSPSAVISYDLAQQYGIIRTQQDYKHPDFRSQMLQTRTG